MSSPTPPLLSPCPTAACPSSHQNDNGIDVKCVAFGPLEHITLHAWPSHHHVLWLYCAPFYVPPWWDGWTTIQKIHCKCLPECMREKGCVRVRACVPHVYVRICTHCYVYISGSISQGATSKNGVCPPSHPPTLQHQSQPPRRGRPTSPHSHFGECFL